MSEIRTNSTVADIRRAMLMQQHDRYEELKYDMAKHFWSMIGTANQVAFVAIDDAVDMMREAGVFNVPLDVLCRVADVLGSQLTVELNEE